MLTSIHYKKDCIPSKGEVESLCEGFLDWKVTSKDIFGGYHLWVLLKEKRSSVVDPRKQKHSKNQLKLL